MEIKSDPRTIKYGITVWAAIMGILYLIVSIIVRSWFLFLVSVCCGMYVLRRWIIFGRVFILSEAGCTIRFLNIIRFYSWESYKWKKWNEYSEGSIGYKGRNAPIDVYQRGVVFSLKPVRDILHSRPGLGFQRNPFSTVFLYIWTPEVEKIRNESRLEVEYPPCYEVKQEEILEKMRLWGVKIKDMPSE